MCNPVLKQSDRSVSFSTMRKLIASSLLLALFNTFGYSVLAPTSIAQTVSQRTATNTNSVVQRLTGNWQNLSNPRTLSLVFAANNRLSIVLPSNSGRNAVTQVRYSIISANSSPMQIDLTTTDNKTALTIFEFTNDGNLRIQLRDVNPGETRPTAFKPSAMVFKKVSNATTVPGNR